MKTKLLESGGDFQLGADKGSFELPEAANENMPEAISEAQTGFKERLLSTTALTPPVQSNLKEFNQEALGILNLNAMTADERTTFLLAKFFKDTSHAVSLILQDRGNQIAA